MNTKKPSNQGRDPNQKDWHEKRIEQGRAQQERAAAAKNPDRPEDDKATLGGSQQRVGSPSKDHNQAPPVRPGDQGHGREQEQARRIQGDTGDQTSASGQPRDESTQSGAQRNEQRTQRPGETGLANENRPGLGTRADPTSNQQEKQGQGGAAKQPGKDGAKGGSRTVDPNAGKPRPAAPQEQRSDSKQQEEQRSTGMSGQSSGV
jgi:hypothetical protein